jgi:VIT1/CCC1 family predicted Fe2+/Mn2+ transporter
VRWSEDEPSDASPKILTPNQFARMFKIEQTPAADSRMLCSSGAAIDMRHPPHLERHFTASETVRDIVIGMSDGLTVPFALAAGLSGAVNSTGIIVTAGLAEIAAGSIAMGLGGYLAARSDAEHYVEAELRSYGLTAEESAPILKAFRKRPGAWVDFMMRFELGLEKPDPKRALTSALSIAGAYIAGGFIPLGPYLVFSRASTGLAYSVAVTLVALAFFGYVKGHFTGAGPVRSAFQTVLIGGLAATAAFGIARAIS